VRELLYRAQVVGYAATGDQQEMDTALVKLAVVDPEAARAAAVSECERARPEGSTVRCRTPRPAPSPDGPEGSPDVPTGPEPGPTSGEPGPTGGEPEPGGTEPEETVPGETGPEETGPGETEPGETGPPDDEIEPPGSENGPGAPATG
jgi:hypothetical protein